MTGSIESAADALVALRLGSTPIEGLAPGIGPEDLGRAYDIQDRVNERLSAEGLGPPIGHKIGCTTTVMQNYLGIPHPCSGVMFETTVHRGRATVDSTELRRPGVECEIAVELAADMVPRDQPFTIDECARHVAAMMASIEIVDDRWIEFERVGPPTLIADNFFNAGCVLGPATPLTPDLVGAAHGRMVINGRPWGSGTGRDILGHPFSALAWLADDRAHRGRPLRGGEVVTLGSVVQTAWIEPGDLVEVEFTDLGRVSLELA